VEQICTIYHVDDTAIWNLREVRDQRSDQGDGAGSVDSGDGSLWGCVVLVGLLLVVWVLATFTPVIFAVGAAGAAWWLLCRLQGLSTDALLGPGQRRALLRTLAVTILAGSLGFLAGKHVQQVVWGDVLPAVEQSRPAAPDEKPGQPLQTVRPDRTQHPVPPLQKQVSP